MAHAEPIATERLILTPFTLPMLQAAAADDWARVGVMIDAAIPPGWPSEGVRQFQVPAQLARLEQDESELPWQGRLIVQNKPATLVGVINLKGRPDKEGRVEIGYEIAPEFRRRGYAREAARALISWCFAQKDVRAVYARTQPENAASIAMLQGLSFAKHGVGCDGQLGEIIMWELKQRA